MTKKKTSLLLRRYVWLVNILHKQDLTFEQISAKWDNSTLNEDREPLAKRTLQRHIAAIGDLFGIEIVCNRKNESRYTIADNGDLESDRMKKWLYSTFSISALISESDSLRNRIILEDIPSGEKYLTQIIEAMRENVILNIEYEDFKDTHSEKLHLHPYCLKVYHRRWYMIARSEKGINKYSLDRIVSLTPTDEKFTVNKSFDPEKYFENVIGVTNTENPEKIILKVYNDEGKVDYFRSLPFHQSQYERPKESDEYVIFEYDLCHTYDLYQEIMTNVYDVEVIEPLKLREEIIDAAKQILKNHGIHLVVDKLNEVIEKLAL